MSDWLVAMFLPFLIQAFTPILVAAAKKGADWFKLKLPGPVILMVAATVAEGINQVGPALTGVSNLPPGASAAVAVGLREFYSQLIAQPTGMEEKHVPVKVPGQLGN